MSVTLVISGSGIARPRVVLAGPGVTGPVIRVSRIGAQGAPGAPGADGVGGAVDRGDDLFLPALVCMTLGDQLVGSGLSRTPAPTSRIRVLINSICPGVVSYGDKSGAVYFSTDNGATAAVRGAVVQGATVHWNPAVAGYNTTTTDVVSIEYEA